MDTHFLTLYRFTLSLCESLMDDISDEEMLHQPSEGVNPPAWILGHLALVNDMLLQVLGREGFCPPEWGAEFGPGSTPLPQEHDYPSKEELMAMLRKGHSAVLDVLPSIDAATLASPTPFKPLAEPLPTTGDLIGHILTTHAAGHLGHLSNWRRQMGRPPLL
jgi:uncharacterized damage-inducible protein DinB